MNRCTLSLAAVSVAVLVTGCGTKTVGQPALSTGSGTPGVGHMVHIGSKSYPVSPNLRISVRPDRGPVGSTVHIEVTGCFDPGGKGLTATDVYYNPGHQGSTTYATEPTTGVTIVKHGDILTSTFRIPNGARNPGGFDVICGDSQAHTPFTTTGPGPTAPPCAASQLTARIGAGQPMGAGQHLLYGLTFTNVSLTPCSLQGLPQHVRFVTPSRTVIGTPGDLLVTGGVAGPMRPQHTTDLPFETINYCNAAVSGQTTKATGQVQVQVGGRWVTTTGTPTTFNVICGLQYGTYSNAEY